MVMARPKCLISEVRSRSILKLRSQIKYDSPCGSELTQKPSKIPSGDRKAMRTRFFRFRYVSRSLAAVGGQRAINPSKFCCSMIIGYGAPRRIKVTVRGEKEKSRLGSNVRRKDDGEMGGNMA